jgi:hypothetical protein
MCRERSILFLISCSLFLLITACGGGSSGGGGGHGSDIKTNVAFVTNATGTADLSSWALSGGLPGLAGADAVCNASATAAGLKGTYVAWLSDDTDDALCRVNDLTGKAGTNCGGLLDPLNPAGPWVRTDGLPFAGTTDELLAHGPITPMRFNEYGDEVDVNAYGLYYTATEDSTGAVHAAGACTNWSSVFGTVLFGNEANTGARWTAYGTSGCNQVRRLVCMQTGSGDPLPKVSKSGRKVFVTNSVVSGQASSWAGTVSTGIDAADEACQISATDAGLSNPGNFKAWLSTSIVNAADRIVSDRPWMRVDGIKVADDSADLLDTSLDAPVNVTEYGTYIKMANTWTGSSYSGEAVADTCSDWTNKTGGQQGQNGDTTSMGHTSIDAMWTQGNTTTCNNHYHLLCFETAP